MDALDFRLLNDVQRDFPLCERPFLAIAQTLESDEDEVLTRLRELQSSGAVSRVGAVFRPGSVGASTLAAIAAPPQRLDAVADIVSSFAEVNHNYEREHSFNLWFVLTAADETHLQRTLQAIGSATGLPVMSLPLLREYRIDLGFDLADGNQAPLSAPFSVPNGEQASKKPVLLPLDIPLVAALQSGLALVARPYAEVAHRAGLTPEIVRERISGMIEQRVIKRFGVIVRHRNLGFIANAMVVFDVPDAQVDRLGETVADSGLASLCYRRVRSARAWPYNLFCMIHSRSRRDALLCLAELRRRCGLAAYQYSVLFSRQCYKQRGAQYVPTPALAYG